MRNKTFLEQLLFRRVGSLTRLFILIARNSGYYTLNSGISYPGRNEPPLAIFRLKIFELVHDARGFHAEDEHYHATDVAPHKQRHFQSVLKAERNQKETLILVVCTIKSFYSYDLIIYARFMRVVSFSSDTLKSDGALKSSGLMLSACVDLALTNYRMSSNQPSFKQID